MKDFSKPNVPLIEFIIDDDTFKAAGTAPGGIIADLADVSEAPDSGEKLKTVMVFLDQVLLPESADLFASRLRDPASPIDIDQAVDVFAWLLEQYTGDVRPTQEASSSPDGRKTTGRSSTGRVRSGVSTRVKVVSDAV